MKGIITIILTVATAMSVYADGVERKVDSLLRTMSLEQKLGQLNQLDGRVPVETLIPMLLKGELSSIMNITDPEIVNRLQRVAVEQSESHIPVLFARDVVHGFRTTLPIPLGMAATFDDALVGQGARISAVEATRQGVKWAFAPMIDISRDPRWGRIAESFGEDSYLSSRMAIAVVNGYQGASLADKHSMAACAKHFVGYGAVEGGRDYNSTYIPERSLRDLYLPPFKSAFDAGCASVMTSFNDNNGLPTSANKFLLDSILRREWGFDGVVVSDWGAVSELINHGIAADKAQAASLAINAGVDVDMSSKSYITSLSRLVASGDVSMSTLDEAVRRVLRLKFRLNLFDAPYTDVSQPTKAYSAEHRSVAKKLAEESVVMLKNDNDILPLGSAVKRVLVVGPLADAPHDQLGTWNMDGDVDSTRTPLKALRELYGKRVEVMYTHGLKYSRDEDRSDFANVERLARKADVVIAFLGEEAILSGEAHCLSDISPKGAQSELLDVICRTKTPVITVFMAGRPMIIESCVDKSSAVLYAWHPGTMGGDAVADILFGRTNPSGKLPVTFPRNEGQIPMYYSYKRTGRPARGELKTLKDIPLNAKQSVLGHSCYYLDSGIKPLFEFGYGLSYTKFEIDNIVVENSELSVSDTLVVSVDVKNVGERFGEEVVQVYVSDCQASVTRPVKELKAYQRVALAANEKRRVRLLVPIYELAFCDVQMRSVVEPGEFIVTVGNSSNAGVSARFYVK